jgi:hypothetical protein
MQPAAYQLDSWQMTAHAMFGLFASAGSHFLNIQSLKQLATMYGLRGNHTTKRTHRSATRQQLTPHRTQ